MFFPETIIRLNDNDVRIMRPLKIRDMPRILRIKSQEDWIEIIQSSVDRGVRDLPFTVLPKLIDVFMKLNFPELSPCPCIRGTEKDGGSAAQRDFMRSLEFMIAQGHVYSEMLEYDLPQFRLFVEAAIERLTGEKTKTKKMDTREALKKLGIPIRSGDNLSVH